MVLPTHSEKYVRNEPTVLKLREKFFSFSGDDCTIKDLNGKDWFKIEGEAMSISSKRFMTDTTGKEIAGYRLEKMINNQQVC